MAGSILVHNSRPKILPICLWNINNNVSFNFRLFPRKPNMTTFFKKLKKPYFRPFWALFDQFGQKWIFLEKRTVLVFQYSNYQPLCQKPEKPNEPFLRKLLDGHAKNQFIPLIYSWDTANFRVQRLIEKSHNLIGQEHFGPYVRNQNFPIYEICSSIQ